MSIYTADTGLDAQLLFSLISLFYLFYKEIKLEIFQVMNCNYFLKLPLNAGYPANKNILLTFQSSYEKLYF